MADVGECITVVTVIMTVVCEQVTDFQASKAVLEALKQFAKSMKYHRTVLLTLDKQVQENTKQNSITTAIAETIGRVHT